MDAQLKVSRALITLMASHAFYASCALKLRIREDNSIQTMATNGMEILWNREFTDSLKEDEVVAIIAHEVLHVIFLHCQRPCRKGASSIEAQKESLKWNIAEDYVINVTLKDDGFKFPDGLLYDEKYRNWSAEQVYADLQNESGGMFEQIDTDAAKFQELLDKYGDVGEDGLTPEESEELKQRIQEMTVSAAESAKQAGQEVHGNISEIVKNIRTPQVNWKAYLRAYLMTRNPTEQSWSKPNRKMLGGYGLYTPSTISNTIGPIAIVLDTSGSVSMKERQVFLAELQAINQELKPEKMCVLCVDTNVAECYEFTPHDDITELELTGYGGTDMTPGFDYIEKCLPEVETILCFSDLEFHTWPNEPIQPTIWLTTHIDEAPYGTVIKVNY